MLYSLVWMLKGQGLNCLADTDGRNNMALLKMLAASFCLDLGRREKNWVASTPPAPPPPECMEETQ